ncbi:hypothetical protein BRD01_13550 [Halobacteriales archaeon QS_8_65_32]|nr:MAG: hypothetical protein BRD01_13550 [Halobacteriales archaeon QS_8_65_32]
MDLRSIEGGAAKEGRPAARTGPAGGADGGDRWRSAEVNDDSRERSSGRQSVRRSSVGRGDTGRLSIGC